MGTVNATCPHTGRVSSSGEKSLLVNLCWILKPKLAPYGWAGRVPVKVMPKQLRTDMTRMGRMVPNRLWVFFLLALGVVYSAPVASANDIYISQNFTGASNGAGCADARS